MEKIPGGSLGRQLFVGGAATVGLRFIGLGLEFLIAILLARALGKSGYGIYAYAFALMGLLAIPVQAGIPTLSVREVAGYCATNDWPHLRGFMIRANQFVLIFSVIVAIPVVLAEYGISHELGTQKSATIIMAMVLLPLIAFNNIRGAMLRGLHRIIQGQLPESVLRPGIFALIIYIASKWGIRGTLSPAFAMGMHVICALISFSIGAMLLFRYMPKGVLMASAIYETRRWAKSAFPLSLVMGMVVLNQQAALIILGSFRPSSEVGLYSVASQCALSVTIPLTAVNLLIAPHISRLFARNDLVTLGRLIRSGGLAIAGGGVAMGLVLGLLGKPILSIAFGTEFVAAYLPLLILCVGYAVCSVFGAAMILLNMTKNEASVVYAFLVAVPINVGLNFLLAPKYGMIGSSISVSCSLITLNLLLAMSASRRTGITTIAVPLKRRSLRKAK